MPLKQVAAQQPAVLVMGALRQQATPEASTPTKSKILFPALVVAEDLALVRMGASTTLALLMTAASLAWPVLAADRVHAVLQQKPIAHGG